MIKSQISKSLRFFPIGFLVIFLASPIQDYKRWIFSLFENRAISNLGPRTLSNHCNSNCVGLIARSDDFQSSVRTPVTIVSSSVDEWLGFVQTATNLPCHQQVSSRWLDRSDHIDFEVQSAVWAPHSPTTDWKDGKILKRAHCVRSIGDKNFSQNWIESQKKIQICRW